MVKIPKDKRRGRKVEFRDENGRYVAESRRYQEATSMYRKYRGKMVRVWESSKGKRLRPKDLADLLPRDEFEALAANYGDAKTIVPKDKHFTAWDLSNQMNRVRGLRGHMVKVIMILKDGAQTKRVTFYRKAKRKGSMAYGFFKQANAAIGNAGGYLYNKIKNKLFPDRKGRKVKLLGWELAVEL